MNEDLLKLYQAMQASSLIPEGRTFDQFQTALADPAKQQELYGFLKSQNFEMGSESEFQTKFFSDLKKKEDTAITPSVSGDSSSTSAAPAPSADTPSKTEDLGGLIQQPARESTAAPMPIQDLNGPMNPDKQYSAQDIAAHIKGQNTPFQPDLSITGKEDPVKAGEQIRGAGDAGYDYRKKYDSLTPYRQEKRNVANVVAFGKKARTQAGFANDVLVQKFGPNWLDDLTALSLRIQQTSNKLEALSAPLSDFEKTAEQSKQKINNKALDEAKRKFQEIESLKSALPDEKKTNLTEAEKKTINDYNEKIREYNSNLPRYKSAIATVDSYNEDIKTLNQARDAYNHTPALEQYKTDLSKYNTIVGDQFFQVWQAGQEAGQKAFDQYKNLSTSGEYARLESTKDTFRKSKEQEDSLMERTMDGAVRTASSLVGSLLTLPRTLTRATGLVPADVFGPVDYLASYGDAIKEWTDVYVPKASKYEQRVFEQRVPFEDKFVVVDAKGQPEAVRNPDGNIATVDQAFIDRFNASGKAAEAKSEFTGSGNLLDKTAGVVTDLLVMRAMGGGSKPGVALSSFATMHNQAYNEAISDLRMDPNDAAQYSMLTSAAQGAIEAYVGDIESTLGKTGRLAKPLTAAQLKPLVGKMTAGELAVARLSPVLHQIGDENMEEILQQITDNELKGRFNADTGAKMDNRFTPDDFKEIVTLTTLATGAAGSVSAISAVDDMKRRAILSMTEGNEKWAYALKQLQDAGTISEPQAAILASRAERIRMYNANLPENLTDDQRSAALAKEWARMELDARAKDESTLPAQRDEAKSAANSLKSEAQQDLKTEPEIETPEENAQEPAEEGEVAPAPAETGQRIGSLRIAEDEKGPQQEPIQVEQHLPEAFRENPPEAAPSTAAATMYANQQPATALADAIEAAPEATGDEVADIGIQTLKAKGYEPTEQEGGQIRRFFNDSMREHGDTPVDEAFNKLADEYIQEFSPKTPVKNRFSVETIEDQAADFFDGGGKINPQSYDRHGDPNYRKDNSVTSLYFKRGGANIDQLAQSWASKFGLSEDEAINRIVDWMHAHGKKDTTQYINQRVAEQENARNAAKEDEIYTNAVDSEMDITPEEEEQVRSESRQEVDDFLHTVDQPTMNAMEGWLGQHTDEQGRVVPAKVREAVAQAELTPLDEGFDKNASEAWDALGEEGKNIIRRLAAGKPVNVQAETTIEDATTTGPAVDAGIQPEGDPFAGDATTDQTPGEDAGVEPAETPEDQNETGRPHRSDTAERIEVETTAALAEDEQQMEAARQEVIEALRETQLPTKLTPALVAEMADQGLITPEEADIIQAAMNTGQEIPEPLRVKAEGQIEGLRDVPEWLSAFNQAVQQRTQEVLDGTAQPGQPIIAEHGGEVMIGNVSNAQAAILRQNGAVLRGRAWVFPAANRDQVFAQVFARTGPEPTRKPAIVRAAGSFAGMVGRVFNSSGWSKNMDDAVSKADGADAKIDAAARHLTPDVAENRARAIAVGQHLSKKFGIEVVTDPDEINKALAEAGHPELVGSPDVRGFTHNGRVYVNLAEADAEVPIHEFGHLWEMAARGSAEHEAMKEAVRGSQYEATVRGHERYQRLSDDEILAEAMAQAIGQRGALITSDSQWERFQDMMKRMWMQMKSKFGIDVQDMRAQEFADYVATMLVDDAPPTVSLAQSDPKAQFLFAGEKAPQMRQETAENLDVARQMETQGVSPDEIWQATGWFRGVDTAWRYMIGDKQARVKIGVQMLLNDDERREYTLSEILHHPELYAQFPEMSEIPVTVHPGEGTMATVMNGQPKIQADPKYALDSSPNPDEFFVGLLLHETQHLIQRQMGFAEGGNLHFAVFIADQAAYLAPDNPKMAALSKTDPRQVYLQIAGEVEARLTQDMRDHEPEEIDRVPTTMMDVAPEDQILQFGDLNESAQMLAGVKPKPQFLFGRKQVANAGAIQAAQQIIEDELNAGLDPAATGTLNKLAKLGINRATAERLYQNAIARQKGARIVSALGEQAFKDQKWEQVKNLFYKYFRVRGLMPRVLFDQKIKTEAEIKGHVYAMQQALNRLGKSIEATLTVKNDQNRNLIWQQVQNVLEGTQDISTLDPSLRDGINELRTRMDDLTKALVQSGAVGPSMAITMLGNSGIDIQSADPDLVTAVGKALNKYPSERTPTENQTVEDFLQQYGGAMGNYLYRSYQANDDPKWKTRVSKEIVDRAKDRLTQMIRQEMADEMQALADKNAPLDQQIADIQQEIQDKLQGARDAVAQAQQDLSDVLAKQQAYTQGKGQPNKTLQRQELAIAKRLQALRQMLRQGEAVANLSPLDFATVINAPGFNPLVLNTLLKSIYARRKQIMNLEGRKDRATTASFARLQQLDRRLGNLGNEIETILERGDSGSIMAAGKLGSVSQAITQGRRQDIPVELRDLLGEYRDPRVNLMRSVLRVATALEHQKFLLQAKEFGLRDGWLATKENKTGPLTVQLASPNSDTMDPLNGLWTTPEIAEVFNTHNNRRELGPMTRLYYNVVGAVKIGMTALSTGSQGRNFESNMIFGVYNGWIGVPGTEKFSHFLESFKAFKTTQSEEDAKEFEEMVRAGVLGNSTTAGDIRNAAALISAMSRGDVTGENVITQPKKGYDLLARSYQATDEMLRVWGFRVEREQYSKALYGKPYKELTPAQQKEMFDRAASIVRRITSDYGLIPKIGEMLRLNPAFGTFVSWQMEIYRTYFNRFALIREEYRDPRLRPIALKRMASLAFGHALLTGLSWASMALYGIGKDEWDALDPWFKPWQQGTQKIVTGKDSKNGEISFVNLGYVDPYAFWEQPYSILTAPTERPFLDKSLDAAVKLFGPIAQPDLVASTMFQVLFNINVETGKKIAVPEYGIGETTGMAYYRFIRKRLQPGIVKTATDILDASTIGVSDEYGNIKTPLSIGANAIGINFEKIQPKMAFGKYILEQKSHKEAILEVLNKLRYVELTNLNRVIKSGQATPDQIEKRKQKAADRIKEMYELTDEVYNKHLRELGVQVKNANQYLGMTMADIMKELNEKHYSSDEMRVILGGSQHLAPPMRKIKF